MTTQTAHWTESSPQNFAYRVASDFVEQVRELMKTKGWSQNKFAKKLNLTPGRISQILNNPGNLTLETMAAWARKLGVKMTVTLYDDGDRGNKRGPVNAEVFRLCWEKAGRPIYMREVENLPQVAAPVAVSTLSQLSWGINDYHGRHSELAANAKPNTTGTTIGFELAMLHGIRPAGKRFEKEGPVS